MRFLMAVWEQELEPLQDRRIARCRKHELFDIVVMALLAVTCGAEGWVPVEQFALGRESWLRTFLALPHGIPTHDTFSRVFAALKPEVLTQCLVRLVQSLKPAEQEQERVIAIDGKSVRRSFDKAREQSALHLVHAFGSQTQTFLAQQAVNKKSNELTAIPKLLAHLQHRRADSHDGCDGMPEVDSRTGASARRRHCGGTEEQPQNAAPRGGRTV